MHEGVGWMEGEGGLLECMGWSGQGSLGEIIEGVSLRQVNEMFEACAWRKLQELRVEREMQHSTEVKILEF